MIKYIVLFYIIVLFFYGCGSPRFAKDGIFVDDVDKYFNPKQDINVWVYANFYPYKSLDHGVRISSLYEDDKQVLKHINFKNTDTKILFSAFPYSEPSYHLLAIQHLKPLKNLDGFEKIEVDSSYYFQRDYKLDRLDIRQVYIPYAGNRGLSLLYYSRADKHYTCPFCKLDYLARVNAFELQHVHEKGIKWKLSDCDPMKAIPTTITIGENIFKKHKRVFLKIYADYEQAIGIQYFQSFTEIPKQELVLNLCPERYIVEWLDNKQQVIKMDSLLVH